MMSRRFGASKQINRQSERGKRKTDMKLEGLRVVDMSQFLPGPFLSNIMADHGADVIKIEPPGGDPGRKVGLGEHGVSIFFRNLNRGKRSVCLDLKDPAQLSDMLELCDRADVFIESSHNSSISLS